MRERDVHLRLTDFGRGREGEEGGCVGSEVDSSNSISVVRVKKPSVFEQAQC